MQTIKRTPTHYVGAVIWRQSGSEIEFLLVDSKPMLPQYKDKPTLTKFPGGTNRECITEVEGETLRREIMEETDLWVRRSHRPEELCKDEPNRLHTRVFYLVDFRECDGLLRKIPKMDEGDEISPPYWASAREVGKNLFEKHAKAFEEALRHFKIS